nr:hypothetical protein [Aliivibrio fischeri]
MIPFYALYTYWDSAPTIKYNNEAHEHYGISLVTLDNVLKLKGSKTWKGEKETLQRLSPDLIPLHKLLESSDPLKSLPENVMDNIKQELNPRKGMFSRTETRPGITTCPPMYVTKLLESEGYFDNDELLVANKTVLFIEE